MKYRVKVKYNKEINPDLPLLLVDFDHTLVKTDIMRRWMFEQIAAAGFEMSEIEKVYPKSKNEFGAYNLNKHIELLDPGGSEQQKETVKKILGSVCPHSRVLHQDVDEFLKDVTSKANVFLFTLGDIETQEIRTSCANLMKSIHGYIFTNRSKSHVLRSSAHWNKDRFVVDFLDKQSFERLIFIDDHPREFKNLGKGLLANAEIIRLKRPEGKYSDLDTPNKIREITTLSDFHLSS